MPALRQRLPLQVALVPPPSDAVCACQPGWGDTGCNQQLIELNNGEEAFESLLPPGQWEYYEVVLPDGDGTLLVEMSRTRGDPILFLKGFDEGFQVTPASGTPPYLPDCMRSRAGKQARDRATGRPD